MSGLEPPAPERIAWRLASTMPATTPAAAPSAKPSRPVRRRLALMPSFSATGGVMTHSPTRSIACSPVRRADSEARSVSPVARSVSSPASSRTVMARPAAACAAALALSRTAIFALTLALRDRALAAPNRSMLPALDIARLLVVERLTPDLPGRGGGKTASRQAPRARATLSGMDNPVQLLVALAVVGMLGRAAAPAWRNRLLATAVWRRIRPFHVLGCLCLLGVVLGTALGLARVAPRSEERRVGQER